MPERELAAILLPYTAALLGSALLERLLQPRPRPPWHRALSAICLHTGIVTILFALELLLFRRPWFAAANVLALLLFLVLVSNAKFHALREPFICQDFEYFSDALRHPRLYLPFLGLGRALLAAAAISGAIIAGLLLEAPLPTVALLVALPAALTGGALLLWFGSRRPPVISCQPEQDLVKLGLLAVLWLYGRAERGKLPDPLPGSDILRTPLQRNQDNDLPDLVVVQSESFFDPRRCFALVRPDILPQFDLLKTSALSHGRLWVPAWGANTVRTEYAFLSGLTPHQLGIHQFNPYRRIARQRIPTLAGWLRQAGYRTVCIHPYPASFYNRDEVYPLLGFDEFIDIREFGQDETAGPYVGDQAVAERVRRVLEKRRRAADAPLLIFVITMENHGPLHLENVGRDEWRRYCLSSPPEGCDDLTVYLRHLENADRMLGMLRNALEASPRKGVLCFFGDHLPIMSEAYRRMGEPEQASDYLIWSNREAGGALGGNDLDVCDLGEELLRQAGLVKL